MCRTIRCEAYMLVINDQQDRLDECALMLDSNAKWMWQRPRLRRVGCAKTTGDRTNITRSCCYHHVAFQISKTKPHSWWSASQFLKSVGHPRVSSPCPCL